LICRVAGDGFTYHLVRSLVGACVAVANGTCATADLERSLQGEASAAGCQQAPARGLALEKVHYLSEPAWTTGVSRNRRAWSSTRAASCGTTRAARG
jgi:tRNA U38,U39,U40 pseudouridine synthase TruA